MSLCITADSKLCACDTRHAPGNFLSETPAAQLGKGQGFAPPRCIPSCVPQAAPDFAEAKSLRLRQGKAETVLVSAPFGLEGIVATSSWEVRP